MKHTTELAKGNVFKYNGEIYKITEQPTRLQPGRAMSYVLLTAHNVHTNRKMDFKLSTSDKVETVEIRHNKHTFLYDDGEMAYFDGDLEYPLNQIEFFNFLEEDMIVEAVSCEDTVIDIELPIELKGKVLSNNGSQIVIEHNLKLTGPKFIEVGEYVYFNRDNLKYLRRVNGYKS